ncbi:MAG: M3 family peptidase [Deltaproteobacteria bacterium]|nr:MAG: M3 family peptidase [Deltaproteobacteria bacterium]
MTDSADLATWTGPFGGVPPLDRGQPKLLHDAMLEAMTAWRAEVQAIASAAEPPTFHNTIEALEAAGGALDRVGAVYWVHLSTCTSPELQAVERELAPKLAALQDEMIQNEALYLRIKAVVDDPGELGEEQRRLLERVHESFERGGAALDAQSKARLAAIHQELAKAYTAFAQNVLADEQTFTLIHREEKLSGLPADFVRAAATQAKERGHEGKWVVLNTRSSVETFLSTAEDQELREAVWRAFISRGDNRDDNDNNAHIVTILRLRRERAGLLGFETHAHWAIADQMARTPKAARDLLQAVWTPALKRARAEVDAQRAFAEQLEHDTEIEPWDFRFYQEKVRRERYDLDEAEIKPYLDLERLREGMFWAAERLHGLHFEQVEGLPIPHPTVRIFEVTREGEHVGLWYFDPYTRPGKRSGAWMMAYRTQARFPEPRSPIVVNVCNFVQPGPDEPLLISWDDARTLFHEFGHALHGLLSDVTYPRLAGTNVARDFVEFPSQLNEHWLSSRELLQRFARHAQTGEPMPADLIDRIEKSRTFNQGFATLEYLASAMLDLEMHLAPEPITDARDFERTLLDEFELPVEIAPRHRPQHFAHVFAGDGYAAAYYSYLWADTLTADAAEAFAEAGSLYDRATADRLRRKVLSVGDTLDPAESFRAFRGRDPDPSALLRDRGFAES